MPSATPSVAPFTFYTNKGCPYAQRAAIALLETKLPHDSVEIDLQNKPVWYQPNINPASKVPAIVYGVKQSDKTIAPPGSVKLAESLVLVDFFADLAPESHLMPADPVERAKARFFVALVGDKFSPAWHKYSMTGDEAEADKLVAAVNQLTAELDPEGPYLLGSEFSIADVAIAPFVGRLELLAQSDIGNWKAGDGPKLIEKLSSIKRWGKYTSALLGRPSVQETFPKDYLLEKSKLRYNARVQ